MASNAVATIPSGRLSITATVAAQYGMEPGPFEQTLRKTVVPSTCTREEFAAFLLVSRQYGLNPILREIYAFPKKGGGIQPIVGVDGWSTMINRHEAFDGMEFEDTFDAAGDLVSITCRMYRKDRGHPVSATEYLSECLRKERDGRVSEVWAKWPRRMLRHKAMIQAARYAFGFSGIIDPDEYDRFGSSPHDPAMLRAQMQIEGQVSDVDEPDVSPPNPEDPQTIAGEEDQRPIEEIEDGSFDDIDDDEEQPSPRDRIIDAARLAAMHGPKELRMHLGKLTQAEIDLLTEQDLTVLKAAAEQVA